MLKNLCLLLSVVMIACNTNTNQQQQLIKTEKMSTGSFKKADWINNTSVYEVNLRQYTQEGTINAFAKELPRLKEMGVQTLWFMPITPIAQKNKKGTMGSYYACADYTSVANEFGTLEDFKNFNKLAHEMGFKVIIDWVANHTGWDHVWTKTHPEYYEKDSATNDFKMASGMDDIIELDFKNPALRKAMIDAMRFWITETDIDGFRCDLAFWVEIDFWLEARTELEKTKTIFWLAENEGIDNPQYYQAFDACYTWKWMHETGEYYKKHNDLDSLKNLLQQYDSAGGKPDAMDLWFTTNHDENSWNGTEYEKYGDMAKAMAVHNFTWNGLPLVYSGQEMPNKKRLKFFDKDPIEWNSKYELQDFYKTLHTLKANNPALRAGDTAVTTYWLTTDTKANVLAYLRKNGNHEVLVLLNLTKEKIQFTVTDRNVTGTYKNAFSNAANDFTTEKSFEMQPWEYLVYQK
jgi:alpha-amylase